MVPFSSSSTQNGGLSNCAVGYDAAYWFGFNGQEKDDEVKGNGNHIDFGARGYDPRTGRWLAVDPLTAKYPAQSPYHFGFNSPIIVVDVDGQENVVVIGNANDPNDLNPHPAGRQILITGFEEAVRLQKNATDGNEGTMVVIYRGTYKQHELNEFIKKADAAGIAYKIVESADAVADYVNKKNGGDSRAEDLVTDFSYVGHSNSQELHVEYGAPSDTWDEEPKSLQASDFDKDAFSSESNANLIGCRTANEDGGRENVTQKFARQLVGGEATGAPFDVMFGYKDHGVLGGAGTYHYQNASAPNKSTGSLPPNTYRGSAQMQTIPVKEVKSVQSNEGL